MNSIENLNSTKFSKEESLGYSKSIIDTQTIRFDFQNLNYNETRIPRNMFKRRLVSKLIPFNLNIVDIGKQLQEHSVIENIQKVKRRNSVTDALLQGKVVDVNAEEQKNSAPSGKWSRKRVVSMREPNQRSFSSLISEMVKQSEEKQYDKQNSIGKVEVYVNLRKNSVLRSRLVKKRDSTKSKPMAFR